MTKRKEYRDWRWQALWWHHFFLLWTTVNGQTRYSIQEELKQGSVVGSLAKDLGLGLLDIFDRKLRPPNNDWRFTQGQRPGPSGATGGPEVAMGTGPWPQPPTEAEQLQALMAAANVSEATATLGPQFTLQHVPDYRQNVYIPGSTATLTSNPQQQQATAQQATQQALPPPQASAQPEPPKAAQTPASKKKSTKKEKK
uniref:Protocadherin 1 gamma 32 n=1 Tax=Amphilophus citrinellus TaxID=61819 RepID=A0A3Q0R8Q9_AMPCI